MEAVDRSLIALKLILEQFGITVAQPLVTKQDPVNMDLVCSCISMVQIIHPLGYDFSVVQIPNYKIRSRKLSTEIEILSKRTKTGELVLSERKWKLSTRVLRKVQLVNNLMIVPKHLEGKFSLMAWVFFLGLYNIVSRICPEETVVEIFMRDYIDFLPYLDIAEETIRYIHFNTELVGE